MKKTKSYRPKQDFKKDYTIHYDPFKVVREGDTETLLRMLSQERQPGDARYAETSGAFWRDDMSILQVDRMDSPS